ncbi:hypothetical protein AAIR98_000544 [Elusimicrobium simillimum]|uniref:hypothetical protein n=1 Tax=Elusimicrobium simillimum TaxID=3143438 RepID=UPI003C6FCE6F
MRKILLITTVFLTACQLSAQGVDYNKTIAELRQKYAADTKHALSEIHRLPADNSAWFMQDKAVINQYITTHERKLSTAGKDALIKNIFDKNDVILFGEKHTDIFSKSFVLWEIYKYNLTADNKITDVVLESEERKDNTEYIKQMIAIGREENEVCPGYYTYISSDIRHSIIETFEKQVLCKLMFKGVNIHYADFNFDADKGDEKDCCAYFNMTINDTQISPLSVEGINLRNYKMLDTVEKTNLKGKIVFHNGAAHTTYGFFDEKNSINIPDLLKTRYPQKNIISVIVHGGPNEEWDFFCDNCKKKLRDLEQRSRGDIAFQTIFDKKPHNFYGVVNIIPPQYSTVSKEYKHRPADIILYFPTQIDENYLMRELKLKQEYFDRNTTHENKNHIYENYFNTVRMR